MITAMHTLLYSDNAEATRRFIADVLQWRSTDAGDGWLIFQTGPSELGVHPTMGQPHDGQPAYSLPQHHEISFACDDLAATVEELRARGARFKGEIEDRGFGLTIEMEFPGAGYVVLFEPHYPLAATLS